MAIYEYKGALEINKNILTLNFFADLILIKKISKSNNNDKIF